MTCPGELELARAVSVGADAELTAHLAACATCRTAWDGARAAIDLARELPVTVPPASRREEVRTAVLAAAAGLAQRPARRMWIAPVIAGAAAAGVVGYLALRHTSAVGHAHGTVRPHTGARFLASAVGPDEVVRLTDGVIDIDVEPLHPGERFRVVVGGAELEVHGTAFTVTAEAGHLVAVAVAHGRVDLQPEGGTPATLAAGQSWHSVVAAAPSPEPRVFAPRQPSPTENPAPSPTASPPRPAIAAHPHRIATTSPGPTAAPAPSSEPAPAAPPAPAPAGRSPEETSYDDAWTALRTGDFSHAATGFARVMLLAPDGPLGEDASFWHAVALARGKRSPEAASAFRDFLGGYPRSAHAGEASAVLGWLLIDDRAYDEAARRFTAAAAAGDPAVRRSAQAGLDALARRKR